MFVSGLLFEKAEVIPPKSDIRKIQAIENKVYRHLLGIIGYATVTALRGEIGASLMESRIMETQMLYIKDRLTGK